MAAGDGTGPAGFASEEGMAGDPRAAGSGRDGTAGAAAEKALTLSTPGF